MAVKRTRLMQNFSAAAPEYDARAAFQRVETARVYDAARMLLAADARILDIGCGTGQFAAMAHQAQAGWRITGLDIAQGMCRAAQARCPVLQADAQSLPLADGAFDAVVSSLCLQWAEDLPQAFAEIARVLRPGGRAIIASLAEASLKELRAAADVAALPLGLLAMQGGDAYRVAIAQAGLAVTMFRQQADIDYYPDVSALLDSMRLIGAGNNFTGSARGLTGAGRWKAMLRAYETLRTPRGIPATWDRLFMILHKPL